MKRLVTIGSAALLALAAWGLGMTPALAASHLPRRHFIGWCPPQGIEVHCTLILPPGKAKGYLRVYQNRLRHQEFNPCGYTYKVSPMCWGGFPPPNQRG